MEIDQTNSSIVVIIGASHAGVNSAFALRKAGWQGAIMLFDEDPTLPYHRPPLSKSYLLEENGGTFNPLQSEESYSAQRITLRLGTKVQAIDRKEKNIVLENGGLQSYDNLIIATGARPFIPPIKGLEQAKNCFSMRTAADAIGIRQTFQALNKKRVVVIGGGYIGLETAASLKKLGATVVILEREERILARVTSPEMSSFFQQLHEANGVAILTQKNIIAIENNGECNEVVCSDNSRFPADMLIVGVGIRVNTELAAAAGLAIENGIKVNSFMQTTDEHIYAIGDCTFHFNPHYNRFIRLESVQNAVDQAKVAAAAIGGHPSMYDTIPWFWSDQYEVKLQTVGLFNGYDQAIVRKEMEKENCFSVWYFKDHQLLAVDAVNNAKAYMLGTKLIKSGQPIDQSKLADVSVALHPNTFS